MTSSASAWTSWKSGSLTWKADLAPAARQLAAATADLEDGAFGEAIAEAAEDGYRRLIQGIRAYRDHPWRRPPPAAPVVWQAGTARLYDHGPRQAKSSGKAPPKPSRTPVLLVPSLVNRSYILDLKRSRSLTAYLARRGLRPLLLDWGHPDREERRFTVDDYFTKRLLPAFERALELAGGRPVPVVGYCMGGLFTLALAQHRPDDVAGLALLATPWDFHAERAAQARAMSAMVGAWLPALAPAGILPVDALQTLFALNDPYLAYRKFNAFASMDPESETAQHFVALEDWLNDGVPMAWPVARSCFLDWYGDNATAAGTWRVAGRRVAPSRVRTPTVAFLPQGDRIVPPASAAALADALPNCDIRIAEAGHIGMVTGRRSRDALWRPLAGWLIEHSS